MSGGENPGPLADIRPDRGVLLGFLAGIVAEVGGAAASALLNPAYVFFVGVLQLAWMLPALGFFALMKARPSFMKGFVLCGVVLFLLSALCFGVMLVWIQFAGPFGG